MSEATGKKRVADSETEMIRVLRYQHLNHQRRLFGGILMQWIDELAGVVAMRHCGGTAITAAVDQLVFQRPAYLGDMLLLRGRITHIGRTSMEVRVDTSAQGADGRWNSINRAYLVMVSMDEDGKPAAVPGIQLETDEERREWEAGEKRNALRKTRREEKY